MIKFKHLLLSVLLATSGSVCGQTLESHLNHFLSSYTLPGNPRVRKAVVKSVEQNDRKSTLQLTLTNGADEIYYNESVVSKIYNDVRHHLPDSLQDYKLSIIADGRPIEYHVPNADRSGKPEKSKLWKKSYDDEPWVKNLSRPYSISKGLDGRHLSLCQSHGRYHDPEKGGWVWQRPRLFCTTEDLLSQTIVIPYIIPMLENAGAIVYTPRDRFWLTHEEIVDRDNDEDIKYFEIALNEEEWEDSPLAGFAHQQEVYVGNESPFGKGGCRQIKSVKPSKKNKDIALVQWIPDIPESGSYPVYVSYQSFDNSAENVIYEIHHAGGVTEVSVNQRMGGGTWVYLGTYDFLQGMNDNGKIVTSNICRRKGNIVSVDAVRLGSGMGNTIRSGKVSGLPRWAEAAKYSAQWYGMSDSCFSSVAGSEYRSDIYSRPKSTNELAGGSIYMPHSEGRKVPIELYMSFHTDAGFSKTDNYIGPLAISTSDWNGGYYDSGMDRLASRDLAGVVLEGIQRDLLKYKLDFRGLWNRNYGESRAAEVPSIILEMLSHQNFADMKLAYDPQFKFDLARSVYKSVLKYVSSMHGADYVVQPLPVKDFSVRLDESSHKVRLSWHPTADPLEPKSDARQYVVYTRKGHFGFDNGTVVNGTTCELPISPDTIYSYKVCALNDGGLSFPSETLSAYLSPTNEGTVLIVNGFTRLEGPATCNTTSEQGFLLDKDPGVQYGAFAGFCGRQQNFSKAVYGSEEPDGLGYSGNELEGKVIMGNTFDYPYVHGESIKSVGNHSFTSMSESAFLSSSDATSGIKVIDMIYGVQTQFNSQTADRLRDFKQKGGKIILSGANLLKSGKFNFDVSLPSPTDSMQVSPVLTCASGEFEIWREMNSESYCVPEPEIVVSNQPYELLAFYSDGSSAAILVPGMAFMGFPLEAVKSESVRTTLMRAALKR